MKKYTATLSIITSICIVIGLIIHVAIPATFGGWSWPKGKEVKENIELSGQSDLRDVEKIECDIDVGSLMIVMDSRADNILLEYEGRQKLRPKAEVDENTLIISQENESKIGLGGNFKAEIVLRIPSDQDFDLIYGSVDAGELDIRNLKAETIEIDMSAGDVDVEDCQAKEIKAECDMGDLDMDNMKFDKLTAKVDMGNLSLNHTDIEDYELSAKVDLGNISFEGNEYTGELNRDGGRGTISLKVNMGDIDIND
ncbi:MAG: DUF4097 domain-containing protein [Pseudobutyrivibrio sp.]|nr:DUF4097 domain-containing protein [Pseudobutyrivibrio sp.]